MGFERERWGGDARDLRAAAEPGVRMVGAPLHDASGRELGEIVDVVVGENSGRLHGVLVAQGAAEPEYVSVWQGLLHDDGRWTLLEDAPRLRATFFPAEAPEPGTPDPGDDWMVGQVATRKLVDRQGRTIVERGQRITAGIVALASRAGLIHQLEGEPREEPAPRR